MSGSLLLSLGESESFTPRLHVSHRLGWDFSALRELSPGGAVAIDDRGHFPSVTPFLFTVVTGSVLIIGGAVWLAWVFPVTGVDLLSQAIGLIVTVPFVGSLVWLAVSCARGRQVVIDDQGVVAAQRSLLGRQHIGRPELSEVVIALRHIRVMERTCFRLVVAMTLEFDSHIFVIVSREVARRSRRDISGIMGLLRTPPPHCDEGEFVLQLPASLRALRRESRPPIAVASG